MASGTRVVETTPATKLRNSCDACAAAKIKCTQEKPSCSYCVKRLKVCVYGASKRVRRLTRSNTQEARDRPARTPTTVTTIWATPVSASQEPKRPFSALDPMSSSSGLITASQPAKHAAQVPGQDWLDLLVTLRSPGQVPSPTELAASAAGWANLGVSADSFPYLDDSAFDLSHSLSNSDPNEVGSPTIFSDADLTVTNLFTGGLGHFTKDPLPTDNLNELGFGSSNSGTSSPGARRVSLPSSPRCHCSPRMIRFIGQLSVDPSDVWAFPGSGDGLAARPNSEQIYDQIESTSTGLDRVLQCYCSNNGDTLVLLSLAIFKLLAWYAAAVNAATSDDNDPKGFPAKFVLPSTLADLHGDEFEGEDQRRIFVQHVLSRLTVLQSLIGRISQRFACAEADADADADGEAESSASVRDSPTTQNLSASETKICVLPFSDSLMRAFTSDLRGRLCELSQAIAEKLRVV